MEQLSGQDVMFLSAEMKGLPQHIGGLSIYDQSTAEGGIVRFKQILSMLESRVHLSPIFTRKLAHVPMKLDRPYWVEDEHFDMEYHVRHISLPAPGDWRQLCILVSRIHARPLDMNKPLWEMYIIEGLDNIEGLPKNCFAMLLKAHHAAMDGATGAMMFPIMHDLSPEVQQPGDIPPRIVEKTSDWQLLTKAYVNNLKRPRRFLKLAANALPAYRRIRQGRKKGNFRSLDDKQKTRFQGRISNYRVVDSVKFSFEDVRSIKNTVPGATINDAMLTIVSGAMRKYLEAKQEMPEKTLVTGCPIDVRSDEERSAGGNMVGFMTVSLCSDILDPKARLEAISAESKQSKSYAEAMGPRIAMDVTDVLPGGMMALAMRAAVSTGLTERAVIFNTIVTNVPGPPVQLYFCGAELVDGLSLGPLLPGVGLFHVVYSSVQNKKGSISISFNACREQMPDPAFYAQCIKESFEELKKATLG
ncbi:wax ester/triacylglycerol synthase family O-acyltransferase [Litorivivens sp.]|uniref:WS/DGAT/MGAT family O-acyltransferase n=2 Tax=Litorivivens sp. TaxID=2020868 RepID=UPI0035631EFF